MGGTFKLEIELGNAAMSHPEDIAEALVLAATRIKSEGVASGLIRDANGNTVGRYEVGDA